MMWPFKKKVKAEIEVEVEPEPSVQLPAPVNVVNIQPYVIVDCEGFHLKHEDEPLTLCGLDRSDWFPTDKPLTDWDDDCDECCAIMDVAGVNL